MTVRNIAVSAEGTSAHTPAYLGFAMREAIALGRQARAEGELPYGAVVIDTDANVIGRAHDRVESDDDLTSHAEILAVRDAVSIHGRSPAGCTMVSTVEPCAMCFSAAWTAGMSAVAFGLGMTELRAIKPEALDEISIGAAELNARTTRRVTLTRGLLADECRSMWR